MTDWSQFIAKCKQIAELCFEQGYKNKDFRFQFFAPWHAYTGAIQKMGDPELCLEVYRDARVVLERNMTKISRMQKAKFQAWLQKVFVPSIQANIRSKALH